MVHLKIFIQILSNCPILINLHISLFCMYDESGMHGDDISIILWIDTHAYGFNPMVVTYLDELFRKISLNGAYGTTHQH